MHILNFVLQKIESRNLHSFCFLSSLFDIPKSVIQDSFASASLNSEYCFKQMEFRNQLFCVLVSALIFPNSKCYTLPLASACFLKSV